MRLLEQDGTVKLHFAGVDSDQPTTVVGQAINSLLDVVATAAEHIASAKGMKKGKAAFLGLAISAGGKLLASFLQENDVIGEGVLLLDWRGGQLADGRSHTVRSENGALELRVRVTSTPAA